MEQLKRIGVLTSGGDAPGMNAAIAGIVKTAKYNNVEVVGIKYGYRGLLSNDMEVIKSDQIDDILNRGGTFLGSARCLEFKEPENVSKAVQNTKDKGIEGLVVIGGDGSFRGARDLSLAGLPTIGIPATIDNDISCTEYTIGYDTALNTVIDCLDKINDTMRSHNRCAFVEVMGNKAGYLALEVAIACGADSVLIAERSFDIEKNIVDVIARKYPDKKYFMIIVSEGVEKTMLKSTKEIMDETVKLIKEKYNIELDAKVTVLGHIQRGGKPTYKDRVAASRMGAHSVELLINGTGNRVVAINNGKVVDYDILEGLNMNKNIEDELFMLTKIISI